MTKQDFFSACKKSFSENGISVYATEEHLEKFYDLTEFMLETNKKMNLTRPARRTRRNYQTYCGLPACREAFARDFPQKMWKSFGCRKRRRYAMFAFCHCASRY